MAIDLGLDSKVVALEQATDAGEWHDALVDLATSGAKSDRNPFGHLATQAISLTNIAPGIVVKWAGSGSETPSGWVLCDGRLLTRSANPDLFAKIGTTFGNTSSSNFRVPDYRRRTSIGAGGTKPTGSRGPSVTVGGTGGDEQTALSIDQMARHTHTVSLTLVAVGSHTHQVYQTMGTAAREADITIRNQLIANSTYLANSTSTTILDIAGRHRHRLTGDLAQVGAANASNITVTSASVAVHYIIKT